MATAPLSPPRPRVLSLSCLRPLIPPLGSSLFADHAYRSLPTSATQTRPPRRRRQAHTFRVRRSFRLPSTASSCCCAAVLRDISAGTSYQTVRLVFRPYTHLLPSSCTSERLRPSTGVSARVSQHRHSSPSFGSLPRHSRVSTGSRPPAFASPRVRSPWSVFQYGSESSAYSPVFSLFFPNRAFFNFPSRYFFAIGLQPVFSLRCFHHRFALHYQAALLRPFASVRGSHPPWPCFPSGSHVCATTPEGLPPGLLPFQSPLLRKSAFVSSLVLSDMLKSRTSSGTTRLFEPHSSGAPIASVRVRHRRQSLVIPYRSVFSA